MRINLIDYTKKKLDKICVIIFQKQKEEKKNRKKTTKTKQIRTKSRTKTKFLVEILFIALI